MSDVRNLAGQFRFSSDEPIQADNDSQKLAFFSEDQLKAMTNIVMPYMRAGLMTGYETAMGPGSCCFNAKDNRRQQHAVLRCHAT